MVLWNITGDVGSGKTILTVCLSSIAYKKEPVFSNFKIKYPNCFPIEPQDFINMKYNKALIILDEAYSWIESRVSSSKLNRYMSYVLFQSRKRGLDIILTEQVPSSIDLRYEYLYKMVIECESKNDNFLYTWHPKRPRKPKTTFMPYENAEQFFDKYDDLEIIEPYGLDNMAQEITILSNPKKANIEINKIVEKAKGLEPITHSTVEDFILQNDFPQILESYVYARLKVAQQKNKKSHN